MHNLWLSWLCVKYGSRLGINKLLQLLPRLLITSTSNHRQSSRFFFSARCVLSRTLRTPRRAANKWDLWTVCNLVFLKTKSTLPSPPLSLLLRHQLGRARVPVPVPVWESERSLAGLTGVWGPRLSWQPDNDLDDELAQAQASRTRRVRARRTASIRQFIVCLLSVTVCYSPLTTHQLPLPFAIALCGLTNSRGGQLIHTKWAQSVKSACCLQVTLYLKISTAQQPESIKLQVAATTPTSLWHYLHATLLHLSFSPSLSAWQFLPSLFP